MSDSVWTALLDDVGNLWPEHRAFLQKSLDNASAAVRGAAELNSRAIRRLTEEDFPRFVAGYRWMCEMVLEEELYFRRNRSYRHSSFSEALGAVYANPEVMKPYMDGLLLSQVLWPNHLTVFDSYLRDYLGRLPPKFSHLEVGPGHGLLLYHAATRAGGEVVAWDVSETSLEHTASCMMRLGAAAPVLERRDLFEQVRASDERRFDSVVLSEVLEHLETPLVALQSLKKTLKPGGLLFANAPVNSPALDHIFLFRSPEELVQLVRDAGFAVDSVLIAPASGYPEKQARRLNLAMSVAIVARNTA